MYVSYALFLFCNGSHEASGRVRRCGEQYKTVVLQCQTVPNNVTTVLQLQIFDRTEVVLWPYLITLGPSSMHAAQA
jgi:hypothetical protein